MNTISPHALRRAQWYSTECVSTGETSAILCWLRRGDQLGSRQEAKVLFRLFSVCFTLSITYPYAAISHVFIPLFALTHFVPLTFTVCTNVSLQTTFSVLWLSSIPPSLPLRVPGDLNPPPPPNILLCPYSLIRL